MRFLIVALLLVFPVCPALAGGLTAQDFAYGFLLDIQEDGAIYSLVVPDEVYRIARRADLADVRVLNASDEVVPHVLRELGENETDLRIQDNVPYFPLAENRQGGNEVDLAVNVSRRADGMIISIDPDNVAATDRSARRSYLLDLSGLKTETGKLEFTWKNGDLPFNTVGLQESDDLVHWQPLVDRATLADLEYGGHRVEQKGIVLPAKPLRYLKMIGQEGQRLPNLQKVTAFSEKLAVRKQRRWLSLGDGRIGHAGARSVIAYNSEFHLPADGARLRFPEANSMIRASVQSRPDEQSPWISRCSAVFYALRMGGAEINNDVCSFMRTNDSQWRLEIIEDGAGLEKADRTPSLELGWTAAELLFVARGPAPFTLAFGSGRLESDTEQPATDMILQAVSGKESEQIVRPAVPGRKIELGGKDVLRSPPPPLPWKQWLLWAILCAGVGLLACMVRHLIREMGKSD